MSVTALDIVSALNVIRQSALTWAQIKTLLAAEEISVELAQAEIDKTESSLIANRDND